MDWRDRGLGLKLKFEAKVLDTFKCHSEIELERTLKSLSKDFRVISQNICTVIVAYRGDVRSGN